MSRYCPTAWASSISLRVGELRHCIVKLLAPSKQVPIALIAIWSHESAVCTVPQLPSYKLPIPIPLCDATAAQIVKMMLTRRTRPAANAAARQPPRHPLYEGCTLLPSDFLNSRWEPCVPDRRNHRRNRAQPFLTTGLERLLIVLNVDERVLKAFEYLET
jgi:hypothetical protein